MTTAHAWSTSAEENDAVDAVGRIVTAMADLLHEFDSARYIDPSGGYVVA